MWKPEHRVSAIDRVGLRYPSDMSDVEWALVGPMIPPARRGGRPRDVNVREVLNAVFYVLATGCQWQALPKDLPPRSTVHHYFIMWDRDGTLVRIHDALYIAVREAAGREASPSAAIIRQPKCKGSSKGGSSLDPQGFDAGKKVTGRKRHILVDTLGLLLGVSVLPANIQDRDGAHDLLRKARRRFPLSGSSPMLDIRGRRWPRSWPPPVAGRSRSSNVPISPPLRRAAKAMDRRTHICMDQPQQATDARFRTSCSNRRSLRPPCHDPSHAQAHH